MSSTSSSAWPWPSSPPSEPVAAPAGLERWYRRLIACYPRSFRKESTEEILAVLLATAREGQRRPDLAEVADLLRGAARMRMGLSRAPRTVLHAVRLMYLGAVAELAVLITLLVSSGDVHAAVRSAYLRDNHTVSAAALGHLQSSVSTSLTADLVLASVAIAARLWLAYAVGKGRGWARILAVAGCYVSTVGLAIALSHHAATYAPAAMIAAGAAWVTGLAAAALLVCKPSWPYFRQRTAARA